MADNWQTTFLVLLYYKNEFFWLTSMDSIFESIDNFKLINDDDSYGIEGANFVEHRHDQSILSILVKQKKYLSKEYECHYKNKSYYINSPVMLYPIHSLRNRSEKICHRLVFLYSKPKYINSDSFFIRCINNLFFTIAFMFKVLNYYKKRIIK